MAFKVTQPDFLCGYLKSFAFVDEIAYATHGNKWVSKAKKLSVLER